MNEKTNKQTPPPSRQAFDAGKIAKAIVLAACELDDTPDPGGYDTLIITVQDLEDVAHRHIAAALERAAIVKEQSSYQVTRQFLPTEDGEFNGNMQEVTDAASSASHSALLFRISHALDDLSPNETIGYSDGVSWIEIATVEEFRKAAEGKIDG